MNLRFRNTVAMFIVALSVSTTFPVISSAQSTPIVDNVFFQTDLRQAIEDIAAQTGVNIIADPSVQGIVSVTIDNAPVESALELILAGTGYKVSRQRDYYLVFNPDVNADFFVDISETRVIELRNLTASSALGLLPPPLQRFVRIDDDAQRLAVTAPNEMLERIVSDLRAFDEDADRVTTLIALEFVRAQNALDMLPDNMREFVRVDPERNTASITAPEGALTEIVTLLRRLDVPRSPAAVDAPDIYRTQVVKLRNAGVENVIALLPEKLSEFVRSDPESNTLAVSAPRHLVGGILEDIGTIDVPRRHVMLDARVVILERGDLLDFGTAFRWPQIQAGGRFADNVDFPWEVRIGYSPIREFTNALSLTLNFLSSNEQATIISSPQILAQDGIPAEIKVTTEEFFQILTEDSAFVRSQLEQIETGTILSIVPRLGGDGRLTLDMNLEVSDVIGRGDNNLPVVSRRTAKSTVQIEDGGTAAVAGLVDTRSQVGRTGVPGAKSVPLLGRLFGSDNLNHQARQVAIFVTANIVDENEDYFSTGAASPPPSRRDITDEQFRAELQEALLNLGANN